MIDFIQLQNDFAHALLGDDWLRDVNVVTRNHLLLEDIKRADRELIVDVLAYLTPRNGRKGCGVIVEVPEVSVPAANLPGPEFLLLLTCVVMEDPITNQGPQTGTLKPADQVAQRIAEVGHGWLVEPHGEFYGKGGTVTAARDLEPLRAFRVQLNLRLPRAQTTRVALPGIAEDAGTATLTVAEGAEAYYTTDGTFPGPGNPSALRYSAAFAVASGTVLRWAAYQTDLLPSAAGYATIT